MFWTVLRHRTILSNVDSQLDFEDTLCGQVWTKTTLGNEWLDVDVSELLRRARGWELRGWGGVGGQRGSGCGEGQIIC